MPHVVHRTASLSAPMTKAYEVVKDPIRLLLAQWLAAHPDSQVGEIDEGVGSQRVTIHRHLKALEGVGVVVVSQAEGTRERQHVRYRLDRARWTELVQQILAALPPDSSSGV